MAYPQIGDSTRGVVISVFVNAVDGSYCGQVSAYALDWETPPAYSPNPLIFSFKSTTPLAAGQGVTFTVGQEVNYSGGESVVATNVQPA
jgi:hypothetical protein